MRDVRTDALLFLAGLLAGSGNAAAGGGTFPAFAALIAVHPLVARWLAQHRPQHGYPAAAVLVPFAVSVYGGYFGAAQGIPFLAAMGLLLPRPIGELNALRILNAMVNSVVAALTFVVLEAMRPTGALDFHAALPLGLGSLVGGWAGVHIVRRLPANVLRGLAAGV